MSSANGQTTPPRRRLSSFLEKFSRSKPTTPQGAEITPPASKPGTADGTKTVSDKRFGSTSKPATVNGQKPTSTADLVHSMELLAKTDFTQFASQENYHTERLKMIGAARSLCQRLESPSELSRRLAWQEPSHVVAMKIAMDLNLFEHLSKAGPAGLSSEDLAVSTGGHPELLARILRFLSSFETIAEVGSENYGPTTTSNAFMQPRIYSGIDFWWQLTLVGLANLPKFLREQGYEKMDQNFADATGGSSVFPYMNEHPEVLKMFANHVGTMGDDRLTWADIYPVAERLLKGADSEAPILVDVGGSAGHDAARLLERNHLPYGRVIVQDLPEVIEKAEKDGGNPSIEFQAHDFFKPQPVQGARAYMLHFVIHDWSDDICHDIIMQIKGAMRKGYSKLLIGEFMVANRRPNPLTTSLDISVGANTGAMERTEQAFRKMVERAGLVVTGIWSAPAANESVIEAELP